MVACLLIIQGCATPVEQGMQAFRDGKYGLAAEKLNKPATDGNPLAQRLIGALWYDGLGKTPQNFNEALGWFQKAANQGDRSSINAIGRMHELGQGVPKDIDRAVAWYTLAARRGSTVAQANLARLGRPVPKPDLMEQEVKDANSSDGTAAALLLLLGGVNAYQQGRATGYQSSPMPPMPVYQPPINCTSTGLGNTVTSASVSALNSHTSDSANSPLPEAKVSMILRSA